MQAMQIGNFLFDFVIRPKQNVETDIVTMSLEVVTLTSEAIAQKIQRDKFGNVPLHNVFFNIYLWFFFYRILHDHRWGRDANHTTGDFRPTFPKFLEKYPSTLSSFNHFKVIDPCMLLRKCLWMNFK